MEWFSGINSAAMYEIVMRLIGPVHPTGEHETDQKRMGNLKIMVELVDRLLFDINEASNCADRQEESMRLIGVYARVFIKNVRESLAE